MQFKAPSITFLCALVLGLYVTMFTLAAREQAWLYDKGGQPRSGDFISMWAAGHVALTAKPADAYDWAITRDAQAVAMGHNDTRDYPWAYPPPYIVVVAAFALLPYIPSMLLFAALTLAAYAYVNASIIGRPQGAVWMLATAASFYNLWTGQNGFLSAALLGAGLLLGPSRPIAAGILIGLLAFKPQLGLLIPIALLAVGNWRMIWAAAATIGIMMLAALVGMGTEPFHAFVAAVGKFGGYVMSDNYPWSFKLQSVFGIVRTLGFSSSLAMNAQIVGALAAVTAVFLLWRSRAPYDLKCAGLAAAATFATPYTFTYDLTLLTVSAAFMIRHALATGMWRAETAAIVAGNLLIAAFPLLSFPVGPFAALFLAAAIVWRLQGLGVIPTDWTETARLLLPRRPAPRGPAT